MGIWVEREGVCAPLTSKHKLKRHAQMTKSKGTRDACEPHSCAFAKRSMIQYQLEYSRRYWIHEGCQHNEERSVVGRVLREVPTTMTAKAGVAMRSLIPELLLRQDLFIGTDLSHTQLSLFPKAKFSLYFREQQSLLDCPLTKRDTMVKAFVKCEKMPLEEKNSDPRMIQARTPRFNLEFGTFTRSIEHHLKKVEINGERVITKGLNQEEKAKLLLRVWRKTRKPVALSFDLSRWDMHVSEEMIKVAHEMYRSLIKDPWFEQLMQAQLRNHGFTTQGIMYKVRGCVMSGDMTTALGNCLLVTLIVLTYIRQQPQAMQSKIHLVDDGDDHVLIVEEEILQHVEETYPLWWQEVGHELRVDNKTREFHQIQFCQHKPLLTANGWTMCPDPKKVLGSAFSLSKSWLKEGQHKNYLGTIWEARAILHQGVPVYGPLFERLRSQNKHRLGYNLKRRQLGIERLLEAEWTNPTAKSGLVTQTARVQFWEQWGVDPQEQRFLEEMEVPEVEIQLIEHLIQVGVGDQARMERAIRSPKGNGWFTNAVTKCWPKSTCRHATDESDDEKDEQDVDAIDAASCHAGSSDSEPEGDEHATACRCTSSCRCRVSPGWTIGYGNLWCTNGPKPKAKASKSSRVEENERRRTDHNPNSDRPDEDKIRQPSESRRH